MENLRSSRYEVLAIDTAAVGYWLVPVITISEVVTGLAYCVYEANSETVDGGGKTARERPYIAGKRSVMTS